MNRFIRQTLAILLAQLFTGPIRAESSSPVKLYVVVFEVTINSTGKVKELKISKVIDPSSGTANTVDLPVPNEYVAAAQEFLSKRTYPTKDKQFFTYTFYDPSQPSKADIDPQAAKL